MASSSTGFMSPARIWIVATHTFTQLRRMKVFYFLIVIFVLMIAVNFFQLPSNSAGVNTAEEHLKMIKNMSFWCLEMFSLIFGICATALLIPKDVEDRILYTILCKPVPRIDYLFGKLLGVLLVIAVATLFMDALLSIVVYVRAYGLEIIGFKGIINEQLMELTADYTKRGLANTQELKDALDNRRTELEALGVTWKLQIGVLAIFLKTIVISGLALLLSTFSTSTLFTIIMSLIIYMIGLYQAEAKLAYQQMSGAVDSTLMKFALNSITVLFPDFGQFNITDSATQSSLKPVAASHVYKMSFFALAYLVVYTGLSWFVFRKKEF